MNDFHYDPSVLPRMVATTRRQRPKDALFVGGLVPYLQPGPVLESGAGCGQLSELLAADGVDITPSDVQPFLVDYMRSRNLPARLLDATDLPTFDPPYTNILAQSISVLITPDLALVQRTYASIHAALPPGGRFIFILPSLWGEPWSRAGDHLRIADRAGFAVVHRFRHQILPSSLYGRLPKRILQAADGSFGRVLGIRCVFVFERRPEPGSKR
jgi:SAM-dependent methyltransferase